MFIPALIAHPGPVVSTSTKPEVLKATLQARRALGRAWSFNLTGGPEPAGTTALRWSALQRAIDWQGAKLVAEAMTGAASIEHDAAHWSERTSALLAACLHAAIGGLSIGDVSSWVLRHDPDPALAELEPGTIASDVLSGIKNTADRERSGISPPPPASCAPTGPPPPCKPPASQPSTRRRSSPPATRSTSPAPPMSSSSSPRSSSAY